MIQNYFKMALRQMGRYKGYSLINILGLALGLACSLLISLYIQDELSYDTYPPNADRIFRVTREFISKEGNEDLHLARIAAPFGS
jgi:putative ABC transport system permease protein